MADPYANFRYSQTPILKRESPVALGAFKDMLVKREQDYNTNVAAADQLELMAADLDVNDADYTVKKELVDKTRGTIQEIADTGGAYEFAGSQMRQLARNFTSNTQLKAALENQVTIREERDKLESRYLKGDISMNAYNKGRSDLSSYTGIGEGAEGVYNKPTVYNPLKYIHIEDKLNKFGQGWKESLQVYNRTNADTGKTGMYSQTTHKYIDENEVRQAMLQHIEGIPDLKAFIEEEARITGSTVEEIISPMIESQVKKIGFSQSSTVAKQIPGFKADKGSSNITGLGGYTQKISVGKNESLEQGSEGLKNAVEEVKTSTSVKKAEIAKFKSEGADSETIDYLEDQLVNLEYLEQSYLDADKRIIANLEADYPGQSFEYPDPAVIAAAKEKARLEYNSKLGSSSMGMMGVDREEYINANYIKQLSEVNPMYADYEKIIQSLGTASNYEGEAILGSNEKANKEIDAYYARVTVPKTGLFYETGPNQGAQIDAEVYEEATSMVNGGVGLDSEGNIVGIVGLKDKDGTPLAIGGHHKDQNIIGGLLKSLSPEERSKLQVSSLIIKASNNPNRVTKLPSLQKEDGSVLQFQLEVITKGLATDEDISSGKTYKITNSNGEVQRYPNAIALKEGIRKIQTIAAIQKQP